MVLTNTATRAWLESAPDKPTHELLDFIVRTGHSLDILARREDTRRTPSASTNINNLLAARVRVMDELERRDPMAFSLWLELGSNDDCIYEYFKR